MQFQCTRLRSPGRRQRTGFREADLVGLNGRPRLRHPIDRATWARRPRGSRRPRARSVPGFPAWPPLRRAIATFTLRPNYKRHHKTDPRYPSAINWSVQLSNIQKSSHSKTRLPCRSTCKASNSTVKPRGIRSVFCRVL